MSTNGKQNLLATVAAFYDAVSSRVQNMGDGDNLSFKRIADIIGTDDLAVVVAQAVADDTGVRFEPRPRGNGSGLWKGAAKDSDPYAVQRAEFARLCKIAAETKEAAMAALLSGDTQEGKRLHDLSNVQASAAESYKAANLPKPGRPRKVA